MNYKRTKIIKRLLSFIVALTLLSVLTIPTFATDKTSLYENGKNTISKSVANETSVFIDKISNTKNYSGNVYIKNGSFVSQYSDIKLPQRGDGSIMWKMVNSEGKQFKIAMHLPRSVADANGVIANNGTIIYKCIANKGVTAAIQPLEKNGVSMGLRSIMLIENSKMVRNCLYKFDLPAGYRISRTFECMNTKNRNLKLSVVNIFNEKNEIVDYIEPSCGKDANGKTVATHYEINGNTLTQVVDLAGDEAFPIILTLNSHPNKITTARLKKSKVKKIMNKIQKDIDDVDKFTGSHFYWIVESANSFLGGCGLAAGAVTHWIVVPGYKNKLKERKKCTRKNMIKCQNSSD